MRAREKMIATSHASAAAPVSFEDTLFQVSMKTQQRHAQARSLEPLPRSSVCLQTPVQAIASAKLQHNYSVKAENTTLISENATLKAESPDVDSGICVWCLEQHSQVAIVPCGHKCLCAQCKSKVSVCPICRGPVTSTLRIFQS